MSMINFHHFSRANLARALKWHPDGINSWSSSDWMTAITGEVGELASLIKMRNRERDGLGGNKFSPTNEQIAKECADVFTYLDLLATSMGIDLGQAIVDKFNEVSERNGFKDRIILNAAVFVSVDRMRLDWLDAHPRDSTMLFEDGTVRDVKAWAIAAAPGLSVRDAIDAAMKEGAQ